MNLRTRLGRFFLSVYLSVPSSDSLHCVFLFVGVSFTLCSLLFLKKKIVSLFCLVWVMIYGRSLCSGCVHQVRK